MYGKAGPTGMFHFGMTEWEPYFHWGILGLPVGSAQCVKNFFLEPFRSPEKNSPIPCLETHAMWAGWGQGNGDQSPFDEDFQLTLLHLP